MQCTLSGAAEGLAEATGELHATSQYGDTLLNESAPMADAGMVMERIYGLLLAQRAPIPQAIGHRIVHGGPRLRTHCLIDASVLTELNSASAFAPLHGPAALKVIRFAASHFPDVPQVACLDTCFHATLSPVASTLALPIELRSLGIQRYGFHGLSCESIVRQLGPSRPSRLIIAHLGNGASITAVRDGISIDTSMGLTPTGGLIMGTRSGDLDPGVLIYLMRELKFSAAAIEELVDRRSGLLGLSGTSGDMRTLQATAGSSSQVRLAIELYCYAVAKEIGAMSVALGGVQRIVFTGGIGENSSGIRRMVCARLSSLGVTLDEARNQGGTGLLTHGAAACTVEVLPSGEDEQIALLTCALHAKPLPQ